MTNDTRNFLTTVQDMFDANVGEAVPVEKTADEVAALKSEVTEQRIDNDVAEAQRELTVTVAVADDIIEDEIELQDTVEGMEWLLDQPQLNRQAINYLYKRASTISVKLGANCKEQIAGQESLETDEAYRAAVRDAISGNEGFMETVKKGSEATANFIKELLKRLKDWFIEFMKTEVRLEKELKDLKTKLDSAELKEEVKVGEWGKYFGRFSDIKEDISRVIGAGSMVMDDIEDCVLASMDVLKDTSGEYNHLVSKILGSGTVRPYLKTNGDITTISFPTGVDIRLYSGTVSDRKSMSKAYRALSVNNGQPKVQLKSDAGKDPYPKEQLYAHITGALKNLENVKTRRTHIDMASTKLGKISDEYPHSDDAGYPKAIASAFSKIYNSHIRYGIQLVKADIAMIKAHIK